MRLELSENVYNTSLEPAWTEYTWDAQGTLIRVLNVVYTFLVRCVVFFIQPWYSNNIE